MRSNNLAQIIALEDQKDKTPMDGDGGGEDVGLVNFVVDIALNGYTLIYFYEDDSTEKYVFTDFNDVLDQIRSKH